MPLQPCSHDYKAVKKRNRRRKEMPTVHFKIIIFWDWLNGIGYFSGYELVERLEVYMSDKERIRVVKRLVLPSVFLYAIPTCIIDSW